MKIHYPKPLQRGGTIGVTAPSSGLGNPIFIRRFEIAKNFLEEGGYKVVEGRCLRENKKSVSDTAKERASDFLRLWKDSKVDLILPPWGGELLINILPLLDFDDLRNSTPKWVAGYSDTSTLLFALTVRARIATAHSSNLMDMVPRQTDPLTSQTLRHLDTAEGAGFTQKSSEKFKKNFADWNFEPDAPFLFTEPTQWQSLDKKNHTFSGRLIGGCVDTIMNLVGTPYGDIPKFIFDAKNDGAILYLENAELAPYSFARALWNMRLAGWFENLNGIILGRSDGPDRNDPQALSYQEALGDVLGDLNMPVLFDADIGHKQPNLTLINGALAKVEFQNHSAVITQNLI